MKKITVSILLLVAVFFSFIPVIIGKYQENLNENNHSVTIVLDAGHGGKDGGASSASGIVEKEVVLSVTKKVENYLRMQGINVILTRDGDYDLAAKDAKPRKTEDLSKRVQIMNSQENGLVVSIHANAIGNSSWSGAQTFYDPKSLENKQLATAIMNSMKNNLETTTREAKAISSLFILKNSTVPTTLVEIGFLSNPAEAEKLNTESYQDQIAYAIYEGILYYLDHPDMEVE
ncbi:N-acetylmuramoyl-L-alanine amidase CwlD [Turicibacter sp. TJ11]|uniref:N-acetylmuramoyl-L-alanine amidase CwlD n=1 Tax=Turicibacter sp. TJ11 TaxID=2806443 RepID=UPI001F305AA2|nr:N-acetylmuramoyl-L-alanine amidase CwlD [Turicibacter sp. TJ11]